MMMFPDYERSVHGFAEHIGLGEYEITEAIN